MIRLVVIGVAVALLTFWLHRRLVRLPGLTGRVAAAVDTVLVVLGLAMVGAFAVGGPLDPSWAGPIGAVGFTWAAVVFYLMLGTLLIAAVRLVARGVARARGRAAGPGSGRRTTAAATAAVAVLSVTAVGYGLAEASTPRVVNESVAIAHLPAEFDGARIVLVTDVHAGPVRGAEFVRSVVDQVNAQRPDVVILGGDLTDGTVAHVAPDLEPLRDLRATIGVFAVSGNHEYYADDGGAWLDHWETLGITTLRNERVELRRGAGVVDLAGVYDESAPEPFAPDYQKALGGRVAERPVVFVAHQPVQAEDAARYSPDVQLSGHTHDGQMWPNTYLVSLTSPVTAGWGDVDGVPVYVTRGTGAWGPPVRVLAPPEITVLTLRGSA